MVNSILIRGTTAALAVAALFAAGCVTPNNHLTPPEFADHLIANGIKVDAVTPLDPLPVQATAAASVTVAGRDIGVYKYNRDVRLQAERLKRITKNGYVFYAGFKQQAFVNGSIVVTGAERNPEKLRILQSLESFR